MTDNTKIIDKGANPLISLNLEKICLGALFKYDIKLWAEVGVKLDENCFNDADNLHKIIFLTLRKHLEKGEVFDKLLIANEINNLNIKISEIDIFEYCDILSSTQISFDGAVKSIHELIKLKVCRELVKQSEEARKFVITNKEKQLSEIIAGIDKINNEKINSYDVNEEPVDLFKGIVEIIEERAKNPVKSCGLMTGFKEFDNTVGGIRNGNGLYAITSRSKHGKSLFLLNIAQNVAILNEGVKVLYLDTEMQTELNRFRIASSTTNVPFWHLETGNWVENPEYSNRVTKNIGKTRDYLGKIYHMNVVNRPINEVCSIVRRWYYKYVGRGNKCLIIYDYLKLTSERVANNWSEHQILGDKVNYLNEIGVKLDVGIFTAAQSNRDAEGGIDNSAIVASSDRLLWFAAYLGIFRRKTFEEISEDGLKFGSHKLIHLAQRFHGKDSNNFNLVNVGSKKQPKYKQNFINYNVENFKVTELGTLEDIIDANKEVHDVKGGKDDGALL